MRRSPVVLTVLTLAAGLLGAVPAVTAASAATPATTAAAPVPTDPGAFVGVTPARVLDTRSGLGAPRAAAVPGRPVHLVVGGQGGVPAGASAAVLNVTVVGAGAAGYLTAYPTGGAVPTASVVNWAPGQTVAGAATVTLGAGGAVDLLVRASTAVDLVADVTGYVVAGTPTAAGTYAARTPTRLLDTRTGNGAPKAPLGAKSSLRVTLAGRGGLPAAGAMSAVVATVTAVGSPSPGYLTLWAGGTRPTVSALNYAAGQTVANQVTLPVDSDGAVTVFASGGPVGVVLDVTGYVLAGAATVPGAYVPLAPHRVFDTRPGTATPYTDVPVTITGQGGVPATGVSAVVANLTVTNTSGSGYLAAFGESSGAGTSSVLNWSAGRTVANQASLQLGVGGRIDLYLAAAPAAALVDVFGYYLPAPLDTPSQMAATPDRTSVDVQWYEPLGTAVGFTIRRTTGSTPPASPTDGTAVTADILGSGGHDHVTDTGLTPSTTYSYAVFAQDPVPNYSAPGVVTTTTLPPDTTPPAPVTHLTATPQVTSVTLRWTPPADSDYRNAVVRRTDGSTPPASPTDGVAAGPGTYTDAAFVAALTPGTTYSFAVFARDDSGNVNPTGPTTTVTTVGTSDVSGTTTPLPPDGIDPQKGGLGIDCPPVGHCVALFWYYDETAARHGRLAISVDGDSGPVSSAVPLPSTVGSFDHPSAAVSCTSNTDCAIVGSYTDDSSGGRVAFTGSWNGTTATTSALPGATVAPTAVDCAAAGSCVAVGSRTDDAGGTHPWVARLTAGTWSEVATTGTSDTGLGSVSCATTTSCAAVGGGAYADGAPGVVASTSTGTSWTVTRAAPPTGATGWSALGPVTCPEAGTCLAAGRDVLPGSPVRYGPALLTLRNGTWATEVLPGSASTNASDPAQVACGGGRCSVLVGNGSGSTVLSRPLAGGTWASTYASTLPAGAATGTSPGLVGIACDATGRCAGAGGWTDANGYGRGFVAAFSSSQNSATSVEPSVRAALGGTSLGAPVCTDAGRCIATADYLASTENSWIAAFTIVGG